MEGRREDREGKWKKRGRGRRRGWNRGVFVRGLCHNFGYLVVLFGLFRCRCSRNMLVCLCLGSLASKRREKKARIYMCVVMRGLSCRVFLHLNLRVRVFLCM